MYRARCLPTRFPFKFNKVALATFQSEMENVSLVS